MVRRRGPILHLPTLAYIRGSLEVLIGADVLRVKDIGRPGEPVASIRGDTPEN